MAIDRKSIVVIVSLFTTMGIAHTFAYSLQNNTVKVSVLESPQKVQEPEYKESQQTRKSQQNTGVVSTNMIKSPIMDGESNAVTNTTDEIVFQDTKQSEPKELSSASPVEEYFFQTQFQAGGIDGCENGTYDESPCHVMSQKLTKAVSTAVETFHRVVGEDFDEDEFFKIFMIDETTGQFKETLDGNLHLTPDDPVGSGERLAKAYIEAERLRKTRE